MGAPDGAPGSVLLPPARPPALHKGRAGPKALLALFRANDKNATSSLPSILSGAWAAGHCSHSSTPVHVLASVFPEEMVPHPAEQESGWPGRTVLSGSPYRLFALIIVLYAENEIQTSRSVHPEANMASEKRPVYLGVRPHGLAYASWHSVAGLIRELPSCLPEFLVSRGC